MNYPGQIRVGYTPVIDCHTARIACQFAELLEKFDPQSKGTIEKAPQYLRSGDVGMVKLIPLKPLCVETFADYPSLGRIAVHDMHRIVAVGIIKEVEKRMTIFDKSSKSITDVNAQNGNE